jgi:allantoate deiminase
MILRMPETQTVLGRCEALARCTEEPGRITRRFATPALAQARELTAAWMRDAGLTPQVDALGNLVGRRGAPGPTVMLGSHLDTVRDGGGYDGPLGVLVAIEAAGALRGEQLPFALEVAAFADEEGARFGTAFLGSALLAGRFRPEWLGRVDEDGVTMAEAIRGWGGSPQELAGQLRRTELLAYLEVHIEQGPVLCDADLPLGVVSGIAGQTRGCVTFTGRAAHAGTTPMASRRDALAAAAEWACAVEAAGLATDGLVATVGDIRVQPGAANIVPGSAVALIDVRHREDRVRERSVGELRARAEEIADRRGVRMSWEESHQTAAVPCDPALSDRLATVAEAVTGDSVPRIASGAGHDAVMLAAVAPVAMLFVRCAEGVSHHPDESVTEEDARLAVEVTTRWLIETAANA